MSNGQMEMFEVAAHADDTPATVQPGYKMTEVGVIPEDWEVIPIGDLVTDFRGGAPLKPSDFTQTGVKVLPKGGVGRTGWLKIENSNIQYCSPLYAASHQRNQVDKSFTIVVLRDLVPSGPSIGLMVRIRETETFVLAQGVYGFQVKSDFALPAYLVQLSNTKWYRRLANSIMVGSTQVHITNTAFKHAHIPLPPIPQQRAIAAALSDVDALLGALDRLLAKKRDVKQGAMQELLTGKRRLPGYSGEWEAKNLGDLCSSIIDGTHYTPTYVSDGIPFYSVENVTANNFTDTKYISLQDHYVLNKRCNPERGDILLTRIGSLGDTKFIDWDVKASIYVSLALLKIKSDVDAQYLYCYTKFRQFVLDVESHSLLNATPKKINMGDIGAVPITLPPLSEQRAIAAILSDMDAEIAALERRREKTHALKQGMMHELLTGRTRLV